MTRRVSTALVAVLAGSMAVGCGRERTSGDSPELRELTGPRAAAENAAAPTSPGDPVATRPHQIYYDLTVFEWYRHGQPLMVNGQAFVPVGPPEAIRDRPLDIAGAYRGVSYYVPRHAPRTERVLVPVLEGYWQPFVPEDVATDVAD